MTTSSASLAANRNAERPRLAFLPSSLLAVASGLLYFLAFPGVDAWPLGFVALVPLIVALRGQSPGTVRGSDGSLAWP